MEGFEPVMAEHAFFSDLPPEYLRFLVGCASNAVFKAGNFVFREGNEADNFYLIRDGKVALQVNTPDRGFVTIQTLGKGEVLGWSWLVPPFRWRFDALALEDTRAIALNGKCLRDKCEQDPRLGFELLKRFAGVIVARLQAARMQALDIYGNRV